MTSRKIILTYALKIHPNKEYCSKFEKILFETYGSDVEKYKKTAFEKLGELDCIVKNKENIDEALNILLQDIGSEGFSSKIYSNLKVKKNGLISQNLFDDTKLEKSEFPCRNKKCRSDQCYFYTEQTRGADEPATIFVICSKCRKRYRFN